MKTKALAVQLHAYYADGIADFRGQDRCGICGLPRTNRTHQIPDDNRAAAEVEAQRLGEKLTGANQ